MSSLTECHILPCQIDFTGKASDSDLYFRPQPLNCIEGSSSNNRAVQLRGRGLLSAPATPVQGCVMQRHGSKLVALSTFDSFVEWHHSHQINSVGATQTNHSRVARAMEWIDVARAIHGGEEITMEK